jgi:hypothetical protein
VDPSTIAGGFSARSFIDDSTLPGAFSYDPSTKTATFSPGTALAPLTEYTVTVRTDVRSADGEPLSAEYTSRFTTESSFWAYDFTDNTGNPMYLTPVRQVGEGTHCYIFLENGNTVSQSTVDQVISEFDGAIYPNIVANFGSEPNPGADGLSKVYIVLLDIRDGYDPDVPGGGYIAGYYFSINEFSNVDTYPWHSNQKEAFFMDIKPGNAAGSSFYKSLAHEFQHMVHWEQKTNRLGLNDDTWLDEAMSEIAPYYAGYGPSYSRVATFESGNNKSDSLTVWGSDLKDYAVAYMWAQYIRDRFPPDVFKNILTSPSTGIESVNGFLNAAYPGATFSSVFRDWSIAVFSGKDISWANHPEWSYGTISTRQGTFDGYLLPGITNTNNLNVAQLPALPPWSVDFYWYTPQSADPAFTWNPGASPIPQASFYDWRNGGGLSFDMVPGQPYPYDNAAVLILQNASGGTTSSSGITNPAIHDASPALLSPSAKLKAVSESGTSKKLTGTAGEPTWICVHDYLGEQGKFLHQKRKERRNAR